MPAGRQWLLLSGQEHHLLDQRHAQQGSASVATSRKVGGDEACALVPPERELAGDAKAGFLDTGLRGAIFRCVDDPESLGIT